MFLKMHENWKVASAVKHIDTNQVLWKYPRSLENSKLLRKKDAASTCWSRSCRLLAQTHSLSFLFHQRKRIESD